MTKLIAAVKALRDLSTVALVRVWNFLTRNEEGSAVAEYALLLGAIALTTIVGATQLGSSLNNSFTNSAHSSQLGNAESQVPSGIEDKANDGRVVKFTTDREK